MLVFAYGIWYYLDINIQTREGCEDMAEIHLTDLIDVNILQQIQDGFARYTGMAALTTDADGIPVTKGSGFTDFCMNLTRKSKLGCKRCEECDRNGALQTLKEGKPKVYYCHAGLVDYAAPIMVEGRFIGSFIGGQVRTAEIDEEDMKKKAVEMGIDPEEYVKSAKQTVMLEIQDINRAAQFLFEISKVLSDMAYKNYEALKKSQKMERAARSQAAFIMDMSLSVQKNMENWLTMTEQAMDSQNSDSMERTMRQIVSQGKEVYSSIEDTVEYIRMSGGEAELLETEYMIRDLLEQTVESTKIISGVEDMQVHIEIEDTVPEYLLGDSGRIGQIVSKLLQNILYFTKNKQIHIQVSSYPASYATMLVLKVQDSGHSISEERFQEIEEYLKKSELRLIGLDDGSGFGLSMVYLLIRQMSGRIMLENTENGGITFTINLPQLEIGED